MSLAKYARSIRWKKSNHLESSHYFRSVLMKSASGSKSPNEDAGVSCIVFGMLRYSLDNIHNNDLRSLKVIIIKPEIQ